MLLIPPYGQHVDTLPDEEAVDDLADVTRSDNTTRGMGLVPVNPPQVTSVVGLGAETDDEFVVTHFSRIDGRTTGDYWGTQLQIDLRPNDSDSDYRADGRRSNQENTPDDHGLRHQREYQRS